MVIEYTKNTNKNPRIITSLPLVQGIQDKYQ